MAGAGTDQGWDAWGHGKVRIVMTNCKRHQGTKKELEKEGRDHETEELCGTEGTSEEKARAEKSRIWME